MSLKNAWGQNTNAPSQPEQYVERTPRRPGNAFAVTGFVLSVLGLGFLIPLFGLITVPITLLGLAISIIGYLRAKSGFPRRGLALAGIILSGLALVAGTIINITVYRGSQEAWVYAPVPAVAPAGPQAQAVVGDWLRDDEVAFRFYPDGTAENLATGERFNWDERGGITNALSYQTWEVDGDTLTITLPGGVTTTATRAH